jgi:hypothetical protein
MPADRFLEGVAAGKQAFATGVPPRDVHGDRVPEWTVDQLRWISSERRPAVVPDFVVDCPVAWQRHSHRGHCVGSHDVRGTQAWQRLAARVRAEGLLHAPGDLASTLDQDGRAVRLHAALGRRIQGRLTLEPSDWHYGSFDPVADRPVGRTDTPLLRELVTRWRSQWTDPMRMAVATAARRAAWDESWAATVIALAWLDAVDSDDPAAGYRGLQSAEWVVGDVPTALEDGDGVRLDTPVPLDAWSTWRIPSLEVW